MGGGILKGETPATVTPATVQVPAPVWFYAWSIRHGNRQHLLAGPVETKAELLAELVKGECSGEFEIVEVVSL